MLPFVGIIREVIVAGIVIFIGILIVTTLIKPTSTGISDILEGSYRYKYKVELPSEDSPNRDLILQNLRCGKSLSGSNEIEITIRFDPESYKNLTTPFYKGVSESELDYTGLRIDIDVMADTYYLESALGRECKKNDDERTITCKYRVEGTLIPKTLCKSGYSAKVPVYVSLWDVDKCSLWHDKKASLTVVHQACIEPGALRGFSKSSKNLGVIW